MLLLLLLLLLLGVYCTPATHTSGCVEEYDWCWGDTDCCDGLGCDFPPVTPPYSVQHDGQQGNGHVGGQAGVCRSVRESLCAGLWEHCDVLPCCEGRSCQCWGDWVVECSCAPVKE